MSLPAIAGIFLIVVGTAYVLYSRLIARFFRLNDAVVTPAVELNDGVDFVPTKPFYLLGQHFSAIAAAGPIAGPILACQQFGWLPCLLWIGLGVVFIGAVHDFSALVASVRHRGHSIAEMVRENIGARAWLSLMLFIWLSLLYVIVAFTDITAGTFVGRIEEMEGIQVGFERGGAVAAASAMYLLLSIVLGLIQKKWNPPLWLVTLVFVPATLGVVWLGTHVSTWLLFSKGSWGLVILVYCFIASLLPMWMLLQPRGYLGGFVLYMALAVGVIGVFFGGYPVQQASFKTWNAPGLTGSLFPFLFVTIACGACSGFHGLVCSGTTSKQISKESDCRPVGYGAMLLEGFVAVIALATIMILADSDAKGAPGAIYGAGMGHFLTLVIGKKNLLFAMTFGAMAFSTFVFDTLDVATRLGRYILQELTGRQGKVSAALATLATTGIPALLMAKAPEGSWSNFWTLFGTSNQLLAALTLLGVTVWLYRTSRRYWFTLLPMLFVMTITFWSLVKQIQVATNKVLDEGLRFNINFLNGLVALLLCLLAGLVILEAYRSVRRAPREKSTQPEVFAAGIAKTIE
jgi:carbon starvation protein